MELAKALSPLMTAPASGKTMTATMQNIQMLESSAHGVLAAPDVSKMVITAHTRSAIAESALRNVLSFSPLRPFLPDGRATGGWGSRQQMYFQKNKRLNHPCD
jgi:hypothetical protein